MRADVSRRAVGWLTVAWAAWNARDVVAAWRHAPFDRLGWVAWLVWFVPALVFAVRDGAFRAGWWIAALLVLLAGMVADVNAVKYAAFALAVAALLPERGLLSLVWLAAAVAWMPVLGWSLGACGVGVSAVLVARLVLAVVGGLSLARGKLS
jgi:hypothetical protein